MAAAASAAARPGGAKVSDIFLARLSDLEDRVERELDRPAPSSGPAGELVLDFARELWRLGAGAASAMATSTSRRAALASWAAAGEVDDLGFDAELAQTVRELVRPLARRWLSVRETASATLPDRGGVLVLLNRSAWPMPIEALVLWTFLCDGRTGDRRTVALWDEDLPELPYASDFLRRIGVVAATRENARVLLERGAVVIAFPEGRAARAKTYDRRYRLARFEAKDVLDGALEAGARIVPGAVVGSEESYPLLGYVAGFPMTAQFPLLGLLGLLPLPLAWSLRLGPAVEYAGADEAPALDAIADAVRARMQAMIGELLAERRSLVYG